MLDLVKNLQGRDLGFLKIVADLWGIPFEANDVRHDAKRLADAMLDGNLVKVVIGNIPQTSLDALAEIMKNHGRLSWGLFNRRYGEVREIGTARRDREKPYLSPSSPAEILWYRAIIGRAFYDSPSGPQEMAYIPQDLLALLPDLGKTTSQVFGRLASPADRAIVITADDSILDHACSLLAALRLGLVSLVGGSKPSENKLAHEMVFGEEKTNPIFFIFLINLLKTAGLVDQSGMPIPEPTRLFLEAERGEALASLVNAWKTSIDINELKMIPGLAFEGEWTNDSLLARNSFLEMLALAPGATPVVDKDQGLNKEAPIVGLASFVSAIHEMKPDFQRPSGDYDSWYIRNLQNNEFLRGFEHWDAVDGEYIRFMICCPLHWLGIIDLAMPDTDEPDRSAPASSFRYSKMACYLLKGLPPVDLEKEIERPQIRSNGSLSVPRLTLRSARYQLARFCRWDGYQRGVYLYRITTQSLERARQQGLQVGQLIKLLRRTAGQVPPKFIIALERWDKYGAEISIDRVVILRLNSPELSQLVQNSRVSRYIEEILGPTRMIIKASAVEAILNILAEIGYLGQVDIE